MKPLNDLSGEEFEALVQRAAALPDAPKAWVDRAMQAFTTAPAAGVGAVAQAGWRLVSAVLRFDSWAAAPQLSTVRGLNDSVRQLLFSADGRDIDLRISGAADQYALMGQVLGPDEAGVVELCGTPSIARASTEPGLPGPIDAEPALGPPLHTAALDDLGEFRIDGIAHGTYRLTLRVGRDAIALPPIQVGELAR